MRKKLPDFLLPLLCGCFLLCFALALPLLPDKTFSEEENRSLTAAPQLSAQALFDGSYTRALGEYFSDQFPLRTTFVRLKTACERLLLRGENNGVLFGKEDYLIPRAEYTDAQYAVLDQNLAAIGRFADKLAQNDHTADIPLYLAPVPRSADVNRRYLPAGYGESTQAVWDRLADGTATASYPIASLCPVLTEAADSGTQVWFRTDHHWTGEGAYLAYATLGELLGYTPYDRDAFTKEKVSENFLGTTYSTAGLRAGTPDTITLWRYEGDTDYRTDVYQNGQIENSLVGFYEYEHLSGKDQYSVYLGGTNAHIRVEPPDGTALPTLIIIKDSYAQSLAPYLARHYRLILLDPRSYRQTDTQPSILSMIEEEQPQAVLLLCGIDTLCGDMDLRTLLLGR